ncbi:MAG: hypothetical protein KDI46_06150 [Alphaproteobacteria bacterium]|nr:hypothetical protein [Alphaproteobacteria bacterium]
MAQKRTAVQDATAEVVGDLENARRCLEMAETFKNQSKPNSNLRARLTSIAQRCGFLKPGEADSQFKTDADLSGILISRAQAYLAANGAMA